MARKNAITRRENEKATTAYSRRSLEKILAQGGRRLNLRLLPGATETLETLQEYYGARTVTETVVRVMTERRIDLETRTGEKMRRGEKLAVSCSGEQMLAFALAWPGVLHTLTTDETIAGILKDMLKKEIVENMMNCFFDPDDDDTRDLLTQTIGSFIDGNDLAEILGMMQYLAYERRDIILGHVDALESPCEHTADGGMRMPDGTVVDRETRKKYRREDERAAAKDLKDIADELYIRAKFKP